MKKVLLGGFGLLSLALVGVLVAIVAHMTDMKLWGKWSPWAELDANAKWTFSEPASGVGTW